MKQATLTPKQIISLPKKATLGSFRQFARKAGIAFKDNGSLVVYDLNKQPRVFAFDAYTLWDILCTLDEKLETVLEPKEYIFNNPVGWLIDAIEETLPISPKIMATLGNARKDK